ncbi:MAG: formylglycine-generating enzyme family protein, partial [Anaerolineales bacterium]
RENAVFGDPFTRLDVQPLADEQIAALVGNWCDQLYAPDEAPARAAELTSAIASINQLRADKDLPPLINTPLMTTMVVSVKWGETELPRERARLYEACVKVILQAQYLHEDEARKELVNWGGPWEDQRDWLSALALAMHRGGKAGAAVSKATVQAALQPVMEAATLETFLQAVNARGGLLEERGGVFQFLHLTFQEFLAARAIAKRRNDALPEVLPHVGDPWWREALLLTYGFAQLDYKEFAKEYLDWLSTLPGDKRLAGLELAGSALLELERPDAETRALQAQRLHHALFVEPAQARAAERARAANTLAALGDPRPEAATLDGMEFCFIPPGEFVMGSNEYDDEKPQHRNATLTRSYWLARYPVTVAQWREYVGHSGHEPGDNDSLGGVENHPVVNVSWHEALAFCHWLNHAYPTALPPGYTLTLPSEAEWEKAARGGLQLLSQPLPPSTLASVLPLRSAHPLSQSVGISPANPSPDRAYPWVGKFNPEYANTNETGIGTTCAIGLFNEGQSPYGLHDMAGNVWEWTRSHYKKYRYDPKDGRETLEAGNDVSRVVRGGAFDYLDRGARCANRDRNSPDSRDGSIGFRVAASPSS